MEHNRDVRAHCIEVIAALGREWGLTPGQQAAYASAIVAYLPERCTESELHRVIRYYHLDHQEVRALRDPRHPAHEESWQNWHHQVMRILRSANLDWIPDIAIDFEDLVQIALKELNEAIGSYRFNSRFSTWAYTVIVRAVQHVIRERRAAKRSAITIPLDTPPALGFPAQPAIDPEDSARDEALKRLIDAILLEQGGPRWAAIFQLWYHEDHRLSDIGAKLGLSTSRVSVLLDQMRRLLREHPALLEWLGTIEDARDAPANADTCEGGSPRMKKNR